MTERSKLFLLGRKVGTFDGWASSADSLAVIFYDFKPDPGPLAFEGDLNVDYEKGTWEIQDREGEIKGSGDLVRDLQAYPKS